MNIHDIVVIWELPSSSELDKRENSPNNYHSFDTIPMNVISQYIRLVTSDINTWSVIYLILFISDTITHPMADYSDMHFYVKVSWLMLWW